MTPDQAIAYMELIRDKAARAAPDCAMAMGRAHRDHLVNVTLLRSGAHPPVTQTPSPPGSPPAQMTGRLRASVRCTRGPGGGMHATSLVSANTIYAATQEWGGVHHGNPDMFLWLSYIRCHEVKMRGWRKPVVNIPERPYMRPSRDDVIADGAVVRAGSAAFMRQVFG